MVISCLSSDILQVELEMAIDTLNPNYCRSKGEQIALNVDGTCTDETSTYSSQVSSLPSFPFCSEHRYLYVHQWLYSHRGCFGHCSVGSISGSNLHFLWCIMNSDLQTEVMDIYLLQLLGVHFENWWSQTFGTCMPHFLWNAISLPSSVCRKLMDKQTFCSSQAASNVSRYAAAVYKKGKFLLLNPHIRETYSFQC